MLVQDRALDGTLVALKIIQPQLISSAESFSKLQNEILVARQLSHRNIVRTFDFDKTPQGEYVISREYIEGCSLRDLLDDTSRELPFVAVAKLLYDIAQGLAFAHSKGVIHQNLKPENILLTSEGIVKLCDFGITSCLNQELGMTMTGDILGAPLYMAPEQFLNQTSTERTDIYSLGIIGFEMACGVPPFTGEEFLQIAEQHISKNIPAQGNIPSDFPPWLIEILDKAMKKKPEERFASVEELRETLRSNLGDTLAKQTVHIPKIFKSKGHAAFSYISAVMLFVSLIYGVLFTAMQSSGRSFIAPILLNWEQQFDIDLSVIKPYFRVSGSLDDPEAIFRHLRGADNESFFAFLKAGVSPHITDIKGLPLTHHLDDYNYMMMYSLMKFNPDLNAIDSLGNTALHMAIRNNYYEVASHLLQKSIDVNRKNNAGDTAVHIAVEKQNQKLLSLLIESDADLNIRDALGRTPLMRLISDYQSNWDMLECANLLFTHGVDILARDNLGRTALHYAAQKGIPEIAAKLISKGAFLDAIDNEGETAYSYASKHKNSKIVDLLADHHNRERKQ